MISGLDHANVRTARLDEMIAWYGEVLGLTVGWRPPSFDFPGAWLYAEGQALVHLVGVDETDAPTSGIQLEHAAFRATGYAGFIQKLDQRGERYRLSHVADAGLVQVNIWAPDGNHLHIDFSDDEPGATG